MAEKYDNTNGGALFPNDKKEKESHPDFRGNIDIEGKEFWIKGWKKTSKSGMKFLSLAVTAKDAPKADDKTEEDPF
jgi:uncharacterized protein (DUF736 family)|tara:strand:- start:4741 stop:4968 length:228 start_codon:yes stop_codon:yes gene_type:complete